MRSCISYGMMNWVWGIMLIWGCAAFIATGRGGEALDALVSGAGAGLSLCIGLAGAFMLWTGLMRIASAAGLVEKLGRLMRPALTRLMPRSPSAMDAVTLNLAANFFGLGSAATPFGLEAMRAFHEENRHAARASDDMCMFIALNASAVELLPATVLALRAAAGSADVYAVVLPTFVSSVLSAAVAVLLCKALARLFP